jgi:hypothetical protein
VKKAFAITGSLMQLGPIIGIGLTVRSIMICFGEMSSIKGSKKAEALAVHISEALQFTVIGQMIGLIGFIFLWIALFKLKYREPWFYSVIQIVAFTLLFGVPLGTLLGIYLFYYLNKHKAEFGVGKKKVSI